MNKKTPLRKIICNLMHMYLLLTTIIKITQGMHATLTYSSLASHRSNCL